MTKVIGVRVNGKLFYTWDYIAMTRLYDGDPSVSRDRSEPTFALMWSEGRIIMVKQRDHIYFKNVSK